MLKKRVLSLLLTFAMVLSLLPAAALAAETDSIVIQNETVTTSATSVTVKVTGYESLSGAKLKLTTGPVGTESDYDMKGRTTLKVLTFTGPGEYQFDFAAGKLTEGNNIQAYLFDYDVDRDVTTYKYSLPVEITDGPVVPSAAIATDPVTNRTTALTVTLAHLPSAGAFKVLELENGAAYTAGDFLSADKTLYVCGVGSLADGDNELTLTRTPAAGASLVAVIRDTSGDGADYVSPAVTVQAEAEPSIVSLSGPVDSAAAKVTVNLTRVPTAGILKVIELDPGADIPSDVFGYAYSGALYSGYFLTTQFSVGANELILTRTPTAGKVLYAVVRDSGSDEMKDFFSEGVTVTAATVPFAMYIKGALTSDSTEVSFLAKMKQYNATPSTLASAALLRGESVLAQAAAPQLGAAMTFSGLSGLTAGETLTLRVTYDGGRTAQWDYVVCDAAETDSFRIVEQSFTPTSTTVTVEVSGYHWYNNRGDWSRICITTGSAAQVTPGDDEGREDLTSKVFTGKGTYTFTIPSGSLEAGNSVMAALRFYDGNGIEGIEDREYYAAADTVLISAAGKTPLERLENCSVEMAQTGNLKQEKVTLGYTVTLDDEIPSGTLGFYAYPGNTTFDPDGNHKISLGSKQVTASGSGALEIDLSKVPVGYRVVASLYVCIDGEDWYRTVTSPQRPEVVDENGQGFQDYQYPDVTIDETELEAGATTLHISITGDERLFQAAREGKTSISVSVAQYPDGESFDFEGENQISLARRIPVTGPFSGQEVTLESPLKAGYRVRAVVYWTQNADLFLAPGNDYEAKFNKPDDSVLVSGKAESDAPAVAPKGDITADAASLTFTVTGTVPSGALLLVKSFDADADEFVTTGGTWVGSAFNVAAGDVTVTPQAGSLAVGRKVVAFLLESGKAIAQSDPAAVTAAKPAAPFTVTPGADLTTETPLLPFTLAAADAGADINAVYLCRVVNGNPDYDAPVATLRKAVLGENSFTIPAGALAAGDQLRIVVQYWKGDDLAYFSACSLTVAAAQETDAIAIQEQSFTVDSTTVTVTVSGYSDFKGCTLYLTTGAPSTDGDGDSRTRLGGKTYTGAGTYTFTIPSGKLTGGNTIQAYLYRYDADADRTYYRYSPSVALEKEPTTAQVAIVTKSVTTDSTSVYVTADFDGAALLTLYAYSGGSFDPTADSGSYVGIKYLASAPSSSQKVDITGTLTAGDNLIAVLWSGSLSGTVLAQSTPVTVAAAPEKEAPAAYILTQRVTAGMTRLTASLRFDSSINSADYKLYQFTGDTLDTETAQLLSYGSLYRSTTNQTISLGIGRLQAGSKLQLVLTAGGAEARSNVITVEPSPDWGTPYAAFSVSGVKRDSATVSLTVDYSDEYLTMGDDFYCDVTVYACSGEYDDDYIEDNELWENFRLCRAVAKANSRQGDATRGELTLSFYDSADLQAGEKLFIKLRLPHVEWEGEEVDYVSASIPVLGADEEIPDYRVVLYNLDADSSRGGRLRAILEKLNIPAAEMTYAHLNETVGYLAGLDGYEAAGEAYTGKEYDAEFMLICNLPEALLDRFLDAMQADGLRIDHKAVVTAYNRDARYYELMDDIADEHSVFQMLLTLNAMVKDGKALDEADYGTAQDWDALQTAITAGETLIRSEEPTYEDMAAAYETLKAAYLSVTGQQEIEGTAVITITPDENGTYTMTAAVRGGKDGAEYRYAWSTGAVGDTLTGISADKLIGTTLTVTGTGLYGSLTAQLAVPAYEVPSVAAGTDTITVTPAAQSEQANTPAASEYIAALYLDGELVETKTAEAGQAITFTGLKAGTAYTVKSWAVSPVGRSDILTQTVTTQSASSGGGSSSGGSSGGSTSTPAKDPNGSTAQPEAPAFTDIDGHWAADAIRYAAQHKLFDGTGSGRFSPDGTMTRAMLWVVLARLHEADTTGGDTWYEKGRAWAMDAGISDGRSPADAVTREQLVTMLWRAAGSPAPKADALAAFPDRDSVQDFAAQAMGWAVENGVLTGTVAGTLAPAAPATRAELAVILQRCIALNEK